ncbi:MAG: redox-regulated ATPase YchF [Chloroflexi bacterium]|nr:redox-regulated ATPase YchF [Chloroflexota bacterium]
MSLSCGLIGVAGSGKTTIFNAITAAKAAIYDGAETHVAVVNVPDPRLQVLDELYHPQKLVPATLKVVDIPAIKTSEDKSGRGSRLLAHIKDVDALLHVVRCFSLTGDLASDDTINPARDIETIDIEMMLADSRTVENKIERMAKKARAGDKESLAQVSDCEKVKAALEQGVPARRQNLSERELASLYECNLVSLKPVLYIANLKTMADADSACVKTLQGIAAADGSEVIPICGRDEAEISQLDPSEQAEFMKELGLKESSMSRLILAAYRKLGLINFFTVGPDEVRAWTCREGDKAPTAAGKIHTDLEKGFIRMEVMTYDDLISLGSEQAVLRAGKQRIEGKTYEIQEGDIVVVRFSK